MKEKTYRRCLVLNADYSPLTIIRWQKAIMWNMKYDNCDYEIDILEYYSNNLIQGTNNKKYPAPAVVRIRKYLNLRLSEVRFSRKNIFIRDDYTCQYCYQKFEAKSLTYDHVVPKSRWNYAIGTSPTGWTNIVTCCLLCNRKKGNRTPKLANMTLLKKPYKPYKSDRYLPITYHLSKIKNTIPYEWKSYLPPSFLEE